MSSVPDQASPSRPTGRRKGDSGTREAILAAARQAFAEHGYAATLRPIAERAGVDVALIRYFFGTKDELFVACLQLPEQAPERMLAAFEGDPERLGERVVRAYLRLWIDPQTSGPIQAMVRTALASPKVTQRLRELLDERLLRYAVPTLGVADADARLAVIGAQLMGVAVARYVVGIGPISHLAEDELVALLAPSIQAALTSW